jgi:TolA-binding protein
MNNRYRLGGLVLAAFCMNASAGVFDEDARREVKELHTQIEKRLRDIDDRMQKLDESVKNLGIIQLHSQIEQLNTEIAKLRGQNEGLVNQGEQLGKRQKDFYLDIDTRLRKLESKP